MPIQITLWTPADKNKKITRVLAGIDTDEGEVLLADRLSEKGQKIDLVIGHHSIGQGIADLHNVMDLLICTQLILLFYYHYIILVAMTSKYMNTNTYNNIPTHIRTLTFTHSHILN